MTSSKLKVAIYCRLSEEDRNKVCETDDSNSIQNQKSMLIKYSMDHNWDIYKIYSDDDYTGSDRRRPEFNNLLEDAQNHKFNIVLCKTQSRFTRELELVEKYIHGLFPIWGIRFISIVDNADTDNKGNKKSRQINGLVNEWYLEDMSENIRSVLTDRRKNGHHIGAFALYGYKKDPEVKGHLIIDEEAAAVVREVFTLYSQGYGKTNIARMLNDRGEPNPTEYKRLHGLRFKEPKTKYSTLWSYYAISSMLVNEMYIGNMVQGKYGSISYKTKQNKPRPKELWYRVEGTHEAIIDRELWDKVQTIIAQKYKPATGGKIGIFAGKVRCMHCGYIMYSSKSHKVKHYLRCPTRYKSKDSCIGAHISVTKLESIVIEELRKLSDDYIDKNQIENNVQFGLDLSGKKKSIECDIKSYQKKIDEYTKGIRELYLDKVKGILSENNYLDLSKDFSIQKEKFEQLIVEAQKNIEIIDQRMNVGLNRRQIIDAYTNIEHLDRQAVEVLIDYILVGKKNPETKEIPIEIHWNF
ncbi:MAG: recombinase family protein [Erysipelotrichaceae bacterium]|nr:recombinase family protein [Erysipelotrichaceae bacterium]